MKSKKKLIIGLIIILFLAVATGIGSIFIINAVVISSAKKDILEPSEAYGLDMDCVLVLGAGLLGDGSPSDMLADRIGRGVELYKNDASDRLLMSGDHGRKGYDEVNSMKDFAIEKGVDADVIFLDHAGFSTYESVYRAKEIFMVKKLVIVTQGYHLYRAVYIAQRLGLEVKGVNSDLRNYMYMTYNNQREFLARCKDFAMCLFKPEPTYLGDIIPISGSAEASDDKTR